MRACLTALFCAALLCGPVVAEPLTVVKLTEVCRVRGQADCPVALSIEGLITSEAARAFAGLLDAEQKRAGASLRPTVTLASAGGDLLAAMAIGREIRRRTGVVVSNGPCHSACVFSAMGGVERNLAGIGLHRPYFVQSDADGFSEADARYKKMLRLIDEYMTEMNISSELLAMMLAIPPAEMRLLQGFEARRIGLNGVDPAYDEFVVARAAKNYGVSSQDLRRRQAALETQCGREEEMRSLADLRKREECRTKSRDRVLWGFDEDAYARFTRMVEEHCHAAPLDTRERAICARKVADAVRRQP